MLDCWLGSTGLPGGPGQSKVAVAPGLLLFAARRCGENTAHGRALTGPSQAPWSHVYF